MKRFPSIKKNADFQTVYKKGKSMANRRLVMYVMKRGAGESRIGISVSKKVGNSVVRHRCVRLIRECFHLNRDILQTGLDIVVVVRPAAAGDEYHAMERAFLHLCGTQGILMKELK
ncbi:MAG: ribonuclease P protein component [Clostridiales bacterium]|nr:ribonuclease P protein component [Clostridiales bacterium]